SLSGCCLFGAAVILAPPRVATGGDFLDKPLDHGGLALNRPLASLVLAVCMISCVLLRSQRPYPFSIVRARATRPGALRPIPRPATSWPSPYRRPRPRRPLGHAR